MKVKLKEISDIQFGTFERSNKEGAVPYLQAKNFTDDGVILQNIDTFIPENIKNSRNILELGDILFAGKGNRFFSAAYDSSWGRAMASSVFYVIKVKTDKILPQYLSAILNLPQNISYFQQAATGSSILSLRKKELEDFELEIPSLEFQQKIIEFRRLHDLEMSLSEQIREQKRILYHSAITKILK
ncbi:restriction endonuclease subunit S [Kaistella palustris]|uniref:restriction endonuclease subunit S n=1 Tax=Kaistella palustris TaxID=493376 RepID=UPI000428F5E8|nr:restriction endonuclease subunit S [Kaistella palustris]